MRKSGLGVKLTSISI